MTEKNKNFSFLFLILGITSTILYLIYKQEPYLIIACAAYILGKLERIEK
jgi:hypothetical protein